MWMGFAVGAKVAYAGHGAGVISGVRSRTIGGRQQQYLVVPLGVGDRTILIPEQEPSDALAPLDEVVGPDGVPGIQAVLSQDEQSDSGLPRPERLRLHSTRMGRPPEPDHDGPVSHSSVEVARVVRDLARRVRDAPGSASADERRLLWLASGILASHIAVYAGVTVERAEALIDEGLGFPLQIAPGA
jgi:CarD family transcriptional regulator